MAVTARHTLPAKFRLPGSFPARNTSRVSFIASATTQRRPQNVEGEFFVDHRCIDCDACRWMAPGTFTRLEEQSAVFKQPRSEEERIKALQALLSCPTGSIHTEKLAPEIREVEKTLPIAIDEKRIPGVYHCGYHSAITYGATSYLIVHQEGNILVDRDDVGEHERWSNRLRCERILHSRDVEVSTVGVEMQLQGDGPWSIGTDFELIHTPGHTEGSVCLFYKPLEVLFTGDHLFNNEESKLSISEKYNFYSVEVQLQSVEKFLELDFRWILPGHGRRAEFRDPQEKNSALEAFLTSKVMGLACLQMHTPAY